jgi:hypothetical protein
MNEIKFSEIWDDTIKPLLDYKLSKNKLFYTPDNTSNQSEGRHNIESYYNSLRDGIKKDFMKRADMRLDRHKVCACVCAAIIECPILNVMEGSLEKNILVNAEIALLASCRVLYSFMLDDAKSDIGFEKFLKERKILCFPDCKNSDSNESYLTQTVKFLCYAKRHEKLNVLALANIFCLLEDRTSLVYRESNK